MQSNDDALIQLQQTLLLLAADVGSALTCYESDKEMLDRCASALVKHLDATFARIWVLDEVDQMLVLRASSGLYTHLDGPHSRIKVGEFKIGAIAQERKPHLTNNVVDDERISDKDWARREGMVAFAGHPLLVEDRLVGVMALFARNELSPDILKALGAVADGIALGVHRKQIETQLREREELFTQFAENMRDVMWITTPGALKHIYISPAYEAIYGRPVKEVMENPHSFLDAIHPEDRQVLIDLMAKDAAQGTAQVSDTEFRIQKPNGEIRWLWTRSFPTFDEHGNTLQIYGITHDITEKKEAERRVNEFSSMVSHELRTPLTSIRAALGLIEGGVTGPLSDETLELISIARAESDRLIRLINDILDMRKIEAGKLQFEVKPLDPQGIISRTLAAMRGFAQENGVELVSSINDERQFMGDDDRVVQVLTNLISNAIKFSRAAQEVKVRVEKAPNGKVRFSVIDKGPGIAPQHASKLFGLFQQVDSSDTRDRGGTGLGLAISKAIIERLGGTIGFESELGSGSTFWFELAPAVSVPSA